MGKLSQSELGKRLQLVRGAIWQDGLAGDDYANLLCGFDTTRAPTRRPGFTRSSVGAWVCTDSEISAQILADERFGVRQRDGTKAHLQILPMDESFLGLEVTHQRRIASGLEPVLGERRVAALAETVRGSAEALLDKAEEATTFDLIGTLAEPLPRLVLEGLLCMDQASEYLAGLALAPDAMATPPTLDGAMTATRALRKVSAALAEPSRNSVLLQSDPFDSLAGQMITAILYLATTTTLLGNAARVGESVASTAVDRALRTHPPLRLLHRVAHTDVEIAACHVTSGEQVVIQTDCRRDGLDLVKTDPRYRMVLPLVRLTATVGLAALQARMPFMRVGEPLWHRWSPVTGRLARLAVSQ